MKALTAVVTVELRAEDMHMTLSKYPEVKEEVREGAPRGTNALR